MQVDSTMHHFRGHSHDSAAPSYVIRLLYFWYGVLSKVSAIYSLDTVLFRIS